jgi:hypothetical protein
MQNLRFDFHPSTSTTSSHKHSHTQEEIAHGHKENQPCIATAMNSVFNYRVKHIDIKYHWIREEVATGSFTLTYCSTADMTADILTKALPRVPFSRLCTKLGLRSVRSLLGRLLN